MNEKYQCIVESFDPIIFDQKLVKPEHQNLITVNVNKKWRFHKFGITGESNSNEIKIGGLERLPSILNYVELTNKVVDVFKMDIENAEWSVLANFDIDYACKYFKQFMLETHSFNRRFNPFYLEILRKLEKCFLLFRRDTRFFVTQDKTEFQHHKIFKLDLEPFENEIVLINYVITYGELYFLNKNFL